jgi:hypothetical protein
MPMLFWASWLGGVQALCALWWGENVVKERSTLSAG